jgi:hypothetical protein
MARPSRRSSTSALGLLLLLGANGALALPPRGLEREAPPLRPCCALGEAVGVVVSGVRMPFVVDNLVAPGALGRHRLAGRTAFDERNGLVATCRGGVVDVGHARTAADLVAWSYAHVRAAGLGAARLELPTADGGVVITLTSTLGDARAADQRAARVSARVAWALARQHERVTWRGARSFAPFSEAFSAFSPEDLYSDLLGVHLARRALVDAAPWDDAVRDALDATLAALGAVDAATTRAALDRLAGVWWAPEVAVPSGALLRARRFDVGPRLTPWPARSRSAFGCRAASRSRRAPRRASRCSRSRGRSTRAGRGGAGPRRRCPRCRGRWRRIVCPIRPRW